MKPSPITPHSRGRTAEARAANWLRRRGYRIVARNYRVRGGEVDLIVRKAETLCFIEVKARTPGSYIQALESIHPGQIRRIIRAAQIYLLSNPHDGPCRFDLLLLDRKAGHWQIRHFPDAFQTN